MRGIKIKYSFLKNIIVLFLSISFIGCSEEKENNLISKSVLNYIPKNTSLVFRINNMEEAKNNLTKNSLVKATNAIALLNYFDAGPLKSEINSGQSLFCFSSNLDQKIEYTLVKKISEISKQKEILQQINAEEEEHNEQKFFKFKHKENYLYLVNKDDVLIISSAADIIKNVIDEKNDDLFDEKFKKPFIKSSSENAISVLAHGSKLKQIKNEILPTYQLDEIPVFDEWIKMDLLVTANNIKLELSIDNIIDIPAFNLFKNTVAEKSRMAEVIPFDAKELMAYTFDNYPILKHNLSELHSKEFTQIPILLDDLLLKTSEISMFSYHDEKLLGIRSKDIYRLGHKYNTEIIESYWDVNIYEFSTPNAFEITLDPLIKNFEANFYFIHNEFIVFAKNIDVLKKIIINIDNENTIKNEKWYSGLVEQISDSTSIFMFKSPKNIMQEIKPFCIDDANEGLSYDDFYITGINYNKEKISVALNKVAHKKNELIVTKVATAKLNNDLLRAPVFVKNSIRDDLDVIVQDVDNLLYLLSNKGEIIWTKQLDGPIIGKINQLDISGYNFVFNTATSLYMIDNYGNIASGFPVKLAQEVTMPLVIIDYFDDKKYKLVITHGKETIAYNVKGKVVKGLSYKEIKSNFIAPPKYIEKWGRKFLVIQEESGELNLARINRKKGINMTKKIEFSGNEWYNYEEFIVSTNTKGQLVLLDLVLDKVVYRDLHLEKNHTFLVSNESIITHSGNILSIGEYKVELIEGVNYSEPKVVFINNNLFVSMTDLDSNKIYLYDSKGTLFPNFPVPGSSEISLDNMDKDSKMEFVTKGESDTVIFYKF